MASKMAAAARWSQSRRGCYCLRWYVDGFGLNNLDKGLSLGEKIRDGMSLIS